MQRTILFYKVILSPILEIALDRPLIIDALILPILFNLEIVSNIILVIENIQL